MLSFVFRKMPKCICFVLTLFSTLAGQLSLRQHLGLQRDGAAGQLGQCAGRVLPAVPGEVQVSLKGECFLPYLEKFRSECEG